MKSISFTEQAIGSNQHKSKKMSQDTRKMIDRVGNFAQFVGENKRKQLIISYDCSDIHDPFGDKLRELIIDKYHGDIRTKSTYLLNGWFNDEQLDEVVSTIKDLFEQTTGVSESARTKQTLVLGIIPNNDDFRIFEIVKAPN